MNPKAIYYALSRMLLPTLTIMILGLMWSLSPTKTFGFLLSENSWAGVLRIILMIAEICWFYYLYKRYEEGATDEQLSESFETIKNSFTEDKDDYNNAYHIKDCLDSTSRNISRNVGYQIRRINNSNYLVIKMKDLS